MGFDQGHHEQGHGTCGSRNHSRAAADKGGDHSNTERSIEPHFGVDAGNDGKSDCLGNEGQGDDDAREGVAAQIGEPVLLDGAKSLKHKLKSLQ